MSGPTQNDRSPDTTALYAWLSRDQDGVEGIIAAPLPGMGIAPLVVTDRDRAERLLRPLAAFAASQRGFPAALVRFERDIDIDRVEP